ncbi:MAG: septal ring lytic transglycosylase RlpA family protein [Bradymonadales bacterium]|nr:septal ring lytic transglycosylase RlpA family protein [Bradymonadales bacterium]
MDPRFDPALPPRPPFPSGCWSKTRPTSGGRCSTRSHPASPHHSSRRRPRFALLLLLALALSGCSAPGEKVGDPIDPPPGVSRSHLTGEARWYGQRHHGRTTASGERFDMHDLTAAHPSLPFGSVVRVIRCDTRQSVVVRINDRGPDGRRTLIDLSRRAAEEIDLIGPGHTRVSIEILELPDACSP